MFPGKTRNAFRRFRLFIRSPTVVANGVSGRHFPDARAGEAGRIEVSKKTGEVRDDAGVTLPLWSRSNSVEEAFSWRAQSSHRWCRLTPLQPPGRGLPHDICFRCEAGLHAL